MKPTLNINKSIERVFFSDLIEGKKNNFDFIRFIAASLVIFSHAFPLTGNQDLLSAISNGQSDLGHLSVVVFFVISGYFITQSYHFSKSIFHYIKARVLRIFPGLIVAILISTFVIGPLVTIYSFGDYITDKGTYKYLEAILLYPMQWNLPGVFEKNIYPSSVNGSLWSIPFEFMFYILVAFLGVFSLLNKKIALIIFNVLILIVFLDYWPLSITHVWGLELKTIFELLLYFVAGMLFFYYKDQIPYSKLFAMISLVVIYLSVYTGGLKEMFVFFGTYLIFYFGYNQDLKTWKFYKYGDFSYGIYIYAFPIQQFISHLYGGDMNPYKNFLISFPITLIFSILSWNLIEKKALDLKRKELFVLPDEWKTGIKNTKIVLNDSTKKIVEPFANHAWKTFILIFILFLVVFTKFNQYPVEIKFPYANDSVFHGGWLPQSNKEEYRWIAKEGSVQMEQPSDSNILTVSGFIPDDFVEIQNLKILVNGNIVNDIEIGPGPIEASIELENNNSQINKRLFVQIVFNETHIPDGNAVDQREMSALISKISIE